MRACVGLVAAAVTAAAADVVPVVNPSFEEPTQLAGGFTNSEPPGWTSLAVTGDRGVFYPTVASWGYTAPHLNQVLYINSGSMEQTLTELVKAGRTYTLDVDVVRRPTFGTDNYFVQLFAGDTLLAEDVSSLTPSPGQFATSTLVYASTTGDGVQGAPLRIVLGGGNQVNFDNVRVSYVPAAGPIGLAAMAAFVARRRRTA